MPKKPSEYNKFFLHAICSDSPKDPNAVNFSIMMDMAACPKKNFMNVVQDCFEKVFQEVFNNEHAECECIGTVRGEANTQ